MQSVKLNELNEMGENHNYSLISSLEEYRNLYNKSIESPQRFWSQIAEHFYWKTKPTNEFYSYNFDPIKGQVFTEWMVGAITNVCYNVVDRNIANGFGQSIAYYWESNDSKTRRQITYNQLLSEVCKFANVLRDLGVEKGDRVAIYMPVTIEFVVSMLACARIGAVHLAVFAGFSSEALADRMLTANSKILITVDGAYRSDKFIDFTKIYKQAIVLCHQKYEIIVDLANSKLILPRNHDVRHCIVKQHCSNTPVNNGDHKLSWDKLMLEASELCEPAWIDAEDPLFILFTSGSTGKAKCIVQTTGGYLLWAYTQSKYIYNCRAGDVFFSTADLGWVVGHTYSVYGALANASTIVLMEGTPFHPNVERIWQIVERYKVKSLLSAPTTIRTLMKYGNNFVTKYDINSLRILSCGGESIDQGAWHWLWDIVGQQKCTLINNYGQTESAGAMFCHFSGPFPMKPGAIGLPFFGIDPVIVDQEGNELNGEAHGYLLHKRPWPAIARTIEGNRNLYIETYFGKFPGYYCCGDVVRRDKDGFYWICNRMDDMLNVSGHLLSLIEVENIILEHKAIAETAAVAANHLIKGQSIHVYLVLNDGYSFDCSISKSVNQRVRDKLGSIAQPDVYHVISAIPRNRTGKVMRKLLQQVCCDQLGTFDFSTMADEHILEELKLIQH